ncbi:MAG: hypothetical protein K0S07_815 [Chlamydiales bacterium]|jgi:hypothetical protein|nr:hypothetical protein [Chlamydiales bacterium]
MVIANETNRDLPLKYHGSAMPKYVNATQISLARIVERCQQDTINLIKDTPSTLSIAASGANALLISSNLGGTIQVNGTAVTGTSTSFNTDFQVGDIISCSQGNRMITQITDNTHLTCQSAFSANAAGLSYKRGGRAPSAFYYLYAISNGTGSNVALALSNRSVASGEAMVDLPSGYSKYRQLPFALLLDASSNIIPFKIGSGWPYRPAIFYNYTADSLFLGLNIHNGAMPSSFTTLSCAAAVPSKVSRVAFISCYNSYSNTNRAFFRKKGATHSGLVIGDAVASSGIQMRISVNANAQLEHRVDWDTSNTRKTYVVGYIVTEVF